MLLAQKGAFTSSQTGQALLKKINRLNQYSSLWFFMNCQLAKYEIVDRNTDKKFKRADVKNPKQNLEKKIMKHFIF